MGCIVAIAPIIINKSGTTFLARPSLFFPYSVLCAVYKFLHNIYTRAHLLYFSSTARGLLCLTEFQKFPRKYSFYSDDFTLLHTLLRGVATRRQRRSTAAALYTLNAQYRMGNARPPTIRSVYILSAQLFILLSSRLLRRQRILVNSKDCNNIK